PRTWGWTVNSENPNIDKPAGPTHVGMDHQHTQPHPNRNRRPHARGDGPSTHAASPESKPQAPRTWGWTWASCGSCVRTFAGPTHVGMDRSEVNPPPTCESRPHARGDGPQPGIRANRCAGQAPRTWGWTVSAG